MPTPDTLTTDKKVAVVIAEGLEEVEALAVVDLLYRAGIAVDMLAVGDRLEVTSSHRITFRCDALLAQRDLADYDNTTHTRRLTNRSTRIRPERRWHESCRDRSRRSRRRSSRYSRHIPGICRRAKCRIFTTSAHSKFIEIGLTK